MKSPYVCEVYVFMCEKSQLSSSGPLTPQGKTNKQTNNSQNHKMTDPQQFQTHHTQAFSFSPPQVSETTKHVLSIPAVQTVPSYRLILKILVVQETTRLKTIK